MRKLRKRKSSNSKLMIIFFLTLFFISVGYSWLHEELSIVGKGNIIVKNQEYDGDLIFEYKKEDWYNSGSFYYNYNITLTNNGTTDVDGWTIEVVVPSDIDGLNCWSANCSLSGNILTITDMDYNSVIAVGTSVSLGVHFNTQAEELELDDYTINGVKNGSGGDNTGGDNTGGDNTGGDNTGGDNTGGDNTGGDNTGGDNTGGDNTGGDNTGGDNTGGDNTGGDNTGNDEFTEGMSATLNRNATWADSDKYISDYTLTINNNTGGSITSWECVLSADTTVTIKNISNANYINQVNSIIISNSEYNGTIASGGNVVINFQVSSDINDNNLTVLGVST